MIDAWEFPTFGLRGTSYEPGEINGQPVRLAGTVHGFHGFAFVYVFCSQETLRQLLLDTGLTFQFVNDHTVTIVSESKGLSLATPDGRAPQAYAAAGADADPVRLSRADEGAQPAGQPGEVVGPKHW